MPIFKIYPYKRKSQGALLLQEAMQDYLRENVPLINENHIVGKNECIITWGNGHYPLRIGTDSCSILNPYEVVNISIDKVRFLRSMRAAHIPTITWTVEIETARNWIREGYAVYSRCVQDGMDGKGICIASRQEELQDAPLYTQEFKSTDEYRVHVCHGQSILGVVKRPVERNFNPKIRTSSGGWGYRRDCVVPKEITDLAIRCSHALHLDFGGIDVIYNSKTNEARILESNTAPELGPISAPRYAKTIIEKERNRTNA